LMSRSQRLPNRLPDAMFVSRVGRVRNWIAGTIVHGELRDLISAPPILAIAESWMIRIELNDSVSIGNYLVSIGRNWAHVDVIGK